VQYMKRTKLLTYRGSHAAGSTCACAPHGGPQLAAAVLLTGWPLHARAGAQEAAPPGHAASPRWLLAEPRARAGAGAGAGPPGQVASAGRPTDVGWLVRPGLPPVRPHFSFFCVGSRLFRPVQGCKDLFLPGSRRPPPPVP
jgi:hypothetical protein